MTGPARFTISEVAVDWQEPMVLQRVMQLANTPPVPKSATVCVVDNARNCK